MRSTPRRPAAGAVDAERLDERQPAHGGDVGGERRDPARVPARGHRHDRDRALPGPRPPAQHVDDAGGHVGRHLAVDAIEERDGVAPRGVVGEGEGASLAAADDAPAATVEARRPQLARLDHHVESAQERPGDGDGAARGLGAGCRQLAGAHRAPSARRRVGVVERLLEELHQAAGTGGVAAHQVGLGGTHPRERLPTSPCRTRTACRWRPSRPGRALDHAVDGEHLEQRLDPAAAQPGARTRASGTLVGPVGEGGEHRRRRAPARGCRRWRSTPRSARRSRRREQHGDRRRRAPDRPDRPAGSRRRASRASRGGCRTPGRACRSPCPSADVATTALTSLARRRASIASRSSGVEPPRVGGDVVTARTQVARRGARSRRR